MAAGFIHLSGRRKAGAIALGIVIVLLGILIVLSGLALLIGLAAIAVVLAVGAIVLRKLTGRGAGEPTPRRVPPQLDPSLEVFPGQASAPPKGDRLPAADRTPPRHEA